MFQEAKLQTWGQAEEAGTHFATPPEASRQLDIKKIDDEQQLVFGEVYVPGVPDSQGDFMTAETIQEMAYGFMRKGLVNNIDLNHSRELSGCYVVESFIARKGDDTFIPGSWVLGVHVPDPQIWALVKSGELNGFSLDGVGVRVERELEMDIPAQLTGRTIKVDGHDHDFIVYFDDAGNFVGGVTGPGPDGHVHRIMRGTLTEEANGHAHPFSFVEGLLDA